MGIREERISVIVPIYDVEKYLPECLDSILGQTYENLEIILVDDGSRDRSGEIAKQFAERDNRIILIQQENRGLSAARNRGLESATGEWIVFADSDDYLHKRMIELLHKTAVSEQAALVWCRYAQMKEDGSLNEAFPEGDIAAENFEPCRMKPQEACRQFYKLGKMTECMVAWNKLYHKSLFEGEKENPPIRYPVGKIFEDGFTTYKLMYKAEKSVFLPLPLYFYRMRSDSIMAKNGNRNYKPVIEAGLERLNFYQSKGETELFRLDLNTCMYSLIHFYEKNHSRKERKEIKAWYKVYYNDYFRKQHWPLTKRIRLGAFLGAYPLYRLLSGFEGIYNKITRKSGS